ncbi:MAG: hypothetical protein Ct9H300mP1_10690 [Planctomycetaceae bacterium]|nr:MAG: hypothetical protein Ct9H300mP1_10690 [Planctomycetaceae bacterium]
MPPPACRKSRRSPETSRGDDGDGEVYGMISFKYRGPVITRPVTLIGMTPDQGAVSPLVTNLTSFTSGRRMGLALEDDADTGCRVAGFPPGSPADPGRHPRRRPDHRLQRAAVQDTRELASRLKNAVDRKAIDLDISGRSTAGPGTARPRPSWNLTADAREHRRAILNSNDDASNGTSPRTSSPPAAHSSHRNPPPRSQHPPGSQPSPLTHPQLRNNPATGQGFLHPRHSRPPRQRCRRSVRPSAGPGLPGGGADRVPDRGQEDG